MTALRVQDGSRQEILYKRDTGYGQGPGQTIANGQPYRLDVWWQAAQTLGVSKNAVTIELAPSTGAAQTLGQTPNAQVAAGAAIPAGPAVTARPPAARAGSRWRWFPVRRRRSCPAAWRPRARTRPPR